MPIKSNKALFSEKNHSDSLKIQLLTHREPNLSKVTAAQLRDYAAASTVKEQAFLQTKEGFMPLFTLSWKEGVFALTAINSTKPRTFVSLDRMLKYLAGQKLLLDEIALCLGSAHSLINPSATRRKKK